MFVQVSDDSDHHGWQMRRMEYIYYSCKSSRSDWIWDGEVRRYLEEKQMMSALISGSIGMDVIAAFEPGDRQFRLLLSGSEYIPFDSDHRSIKGIRELYGDLQYLGDHLDAAWPGRDSRVEAADSTLLTLRGMDYWKLLTILDRIAHTRDTRVCKWVFYFDQQDHYLLLPPAALIRAHRDSHIAVADQPTRAIGTHDSGSTGDVSFALESQRVTIDDSRRGSYRARFLVSKILGPDEFLTSDGHLVRVRQRDLVGRQVGDELVAYMSSQPQAVIDLTDPGVEKKWQSQTNHDDSLEGCPDRPA